MITEDQINEVVETLSDQPIVFEDHLQQWMEWQPHIASYLFSDSFSLLNEDEKEAFVFGATVILTLARKHGNRQEKIDEEEVGECEESNYELLESQGSKAPSSKMDIFFEKSREEDLLSFIEDLCIDEEEEDFTADGMEVMVVGLKTVVDVLFLE